jgi:hypothetical protein
MLIEVFDERQRMLARHSNDLIPERSGMEPESNNVGRQDHLYVGLEWNCNLDRSEYVPN